MKMIARGAVPTSAGSAEYTVPTGYQTILKEINICNTTTGVLTVSIHFVASGDSASTSNAIVYDMPVAAKGTRDLSGEHVLNANDFIQVIGSASGLSMYISGDEVRIR